MRASMRLALLLVVPALVLAAAPLASAAATCTDDLIESVFVCVGPGRCASVHTGPSSTERCAPRVCTAHLVESVGVCDDPSANCATAWVGTLSRDVCYGASTTAGASPICVTWHPTFVCVEPPCVYGSYGYLPFGYCLDPRALA